MNFVKISSTGWVNLDEIVQVELAADGTGTIAMAYSGRTGVCYADGDYAKAILERIERGPCYMGEVLTSHVEPHSTSPPNAL